MGICLYDIYLFELFLFTFSINISRHTERTFLMPLPTCINEDCSNSVVVEADVHHVPSFVGVS